MTDSLIPPLNATRLSHATARALGAALSLGLACCAGQAQAAEPAQATPSWTEGFSLYLGGAYIDLHVKAAPLSSQPATLPDGYHARIKISDAATVGFGASYRFSPQWSAELAAGLPPEHSVYGDDFIAPFGQITLVKQAGPTVFANYHFAECAPGLSLFAGPGLNYTRFIKTRSTASGDAASGGSTRVKLSPSWGLAAHVGGTWQLDRHWSLVSTVAYADVRSHMTATTQANLGNGPQTVVRDTHIIFRPLVYSMSVGYTF
jgi:outer membrane protein